MKIISLKSKNINSLKGDTHVDFEKLTKDGSLFAITGATGSGKSTILDIISCALYGKTPRLKNPSELISKGTGEAFCEVEFEVNGVRYRTSWKQHKARKSPNGALQPASMELVDLEKGKVITQKSSEVPKKVEELSGLDFERFTKSMLLAQGEFDAFLKANEKKRSDILEKITGTQIYADISMLVFEKYKKLERDVEQERKLLGSIDVLEDSEIDLKKQQLKSMEAEKKVQDKNFDVISNKIVWLENFEEMGKEFEKYSFDYENIKNEMELNKGLFLKLDLANKALNVWSDFKSFEQKQQDVQKDKQQLKVLDEELQSLKAGLDTLEVNYKNKEKELMAQTKIFEMESKKLKECFDLEHTHSLKLDNYKNIKYELEGKKSELEKLKEEKTKLELLNSENNYAVLYKKYSEKVKSYEDLTDDKLNIVGLDEKIEKRLDELENILGKYEKYKHLLEMLEKEEKEFVENEKLLVLYSSKQKILEDYIKTLKEKKEKENLLKKYEVDRAKLKNNQPCFLCGSTHHPFVEDGYVEVEKVCDDILDEKEEELKYLISEIGKVSTKKDRALSEKQKIDNELNRFVNFFQDLDLSVEDELKLVNEKTELQSKAKELKNFKIKKDKLLRERDELLQLVEKEKTNQEKIKINKTKNETMQKLCVEDISKLEQALSVCDAELADLTLKRNSILNVIDLEKYKDEITKIYKKVQSEFHSLEVNSNKISVEYSEKQKYKKELENRVVQNDKELKNSVEKLKNLYLENGFVDENELKKAKLEDEEKKDLEKRCGELNGRFKQIKVLYEQSKSKLENMKKNEIKESKEYLKTKKTELLEQRENLLKKLGSLKTEIDINSNNSKKLQDGIRLLKVKEEELGVWIKLNELIGSSNGDKFKKFVQVITLEHLIHLANKHLEIISPRYKLTKLERDDKNNIDLGIVDMYQGNIVRSVHTLSGGESFIVSLSFALGLSDLSSKKISIDSLFLDEGFGTLDSQNLDMALNALNLLQSRGKMVGVISHVEALKERIPLQIKVTSKGNGVSVVQW